MIPAVVRVILFLLQIRSCSIKLKERKIDAPELEKGKMKDVELHYV